MKAIAILLATYNGGCYLSMQLDSILNQSFQDYKIYIRDDGSTDNTLEVLSEYKKRYPQVIVLMDDKTLHRGAAQSFLWLLEHVNAPYYMFCDQDDIWLPEKIQWSIDEMCRRESCGEAPIIVHTDMRVVDENLQELAPSFWQSMRLLPTHSSFYDLLACNNANGCTMLFNQKAKECILPNKEQAPMHDCWAALCVAARPEGQLVGLKQKTVLYRQHAHNVLGAQRISGKYFWGKLRSIIKSVRRAKILLHQYAHIKDISIWKYLYSKVKVLTLRFIYCYDYTKP